MSSKEGISRLIIVSRPNEFLISHGVRLFSQWRTNDAVDCENILFLIIIVRWSMHLGLDIGS